MKKDMIKIGQKYQTETAKLPICNVIFEILWVKNVKLPCKFAKKKLSISYVTQSITNIFFSYILFFCV